MNAWPKTKQAGQTLFLSWAMTMPTRPSAYADRFAKVAPTPNIDRIAQNGMRFDRCLVTNSMAGQKKTLNRLPTREEYVIWTSKSF